MHAVFHLNNHYSEVFDIYVANTKSRACSSCTFKLRLIKKELVRFLNVKGYPAKIAECTYVAK